MKNGLQISLFSQLEVCIKGQPHYIQNKKARELLALLLVYRGGPVKKLWVAETLWPQAEQQQALDSLYKVLRFWKNEELLGAYFPLHNRTNELGLNTQDLFCDLWAFESDVASENPSQMERAVAYYTGTLLFQEYYEWTAEREAYYEIQYIKLLDDLIAHFQKIKDPSKAKYYEKRKEFL